MDSVSKKKVKIVATLSPQVKNSAAISKLIRAGANIFRINCAHLKSRYEFKKLVKTIRAAEEETKIAVSILTDIAGPKVRLGNVLHIKELKNGEEIVFSRDNKENCLTLNTPQILKKLKPEMHIYLGDGTIKLRVVSARASEVRTRVLIGGVLRPRMGFQAEGITLQEFTLSYKDKSDLKLAMKSGVDAIAVSFVQQSWDLKHVRKLMRKNRAPLLFAKIETQDAVLNIEEIIDVADGLLIARGDLGFSVPLAELPFIQKELIRLALKKAKPVITATQMLESMMTNPYPTRAEVTDVAKAILDGTDALMLSGETAVGKFPEETVRMMSSIIKAAEPRISLREFPEESSTASAVSAGVIKMAREVGAHLIIVFTESGGTARRIARHRSVEPIIALTPNQRTVEQLNFSWNVCPRLIKEIKSFDNLLRVARVYARKNGILNLKKGERYIISAGLPLGKSGTTNLLLVQKL